MLHQCRCQRLARHRAAGCRHDVPERHDGGELESARTDWSSGVTRPAGFSWANWFAGLRRALLGQPVRRVRRVLLDQRARLVRRAIRGPLVALAPVRQSRRWRLVTPTARSAARRSLTAAATLPTCAPALPGQQERPGRRARQALRVQQVRQVRQVRQEGSPVPPMAALPGLYQSALEATIR